MYSAMNYLAVVVITLLITLGHSKQICKKDSDCDHLGSLKCIKEMCDWGICSCDRGKVAMFGGSDRSYVCVPLRRVGQSCSETGTTGICGAPNSYCRDGTCICDVRNEQLKYEAHWGGELCVLMNEPSKYSSEAQSDNGIGQCVNGTEAQSGMQWTGPFDRLPEPYDKLPNSPLDGLPNVCACAQGYHSGTPNVYGASAWVGGRSPECVPNGIGDLCMNALDCSLVKHFDNITKLWESGNAMCKSDRCACPTGTVKDITGLYCGQEIKKDELCYVTAGGMGGTTNTTGSSWVVEGGVCNGAEGLRCGDPCSLVALTNLTCVCDPLTTEERGGRCRQKEGSSCTSDSQCSGLSGGRCVNGECTNVNSAPTRVPDTLLVAMVGLIVTTLMEWGNRID